MGVPSPSVSNSVQLVRTPADVVYDALINFRSVNDLTKPAVELGVDKAKLYSDLIPWNCL